jgi:hypothetical protein
MVRLSAGTTNFFLDGNKLDPDVQLTTNLHPVTKIRISGVIPQSSYTPSWCSQGQIYSHEHFWTFYAIRCETQGNDSLLLTEIHETSGLSASQQAVLHTATHLFTHVTTAGLSRIPHTVIASSWTAKVIT